MEGLEKSCHNRPLFFIEQVGRLIQRAEKVSKQEEVICAERRQQRLLCEQVTRQLTGHISFSKTFFKDYYQHLPEAKQAAYRLPLAEPKLLADLIRYQVRMPLSLLTHLPKGSLTVSRFLSFWELLHCLVHKQTLTVEHVLLSHAEDKSRLDVLLESEHYLQYQHLLQDFATDMPRGIHRLFVQVQFDGEFSKEPQEPFILLDLAEMNGDYKLVNVNFVTNRHASCQKQYDLLAVEYKKAEDVLDLPIWHATPRSLFSAWKQQSYRFWSIRPRLLRHIDQTLFAYSQMMQTQSKTAMQVSFEELVYLTKLQQATLIWLKDRQPRLGRAATLWSLYQWINTRFQQQAYICLAQNYYDALVLSESEGALADIFRRIHESVT